MAEFGSTAKPTFIAGTNLSGCGGPNTTQLLYTMGGQQVTSYYSGVGQAATAVLARAGGGRLDTIQGISAAALPLGASGFPVIFIDSHAAGTYSSTSGHKILAVLDPRQVLQATIPTLFNSGAVFFGTAPIQVGVPFSSGLMISALSGALGFTCSWTPVVSG